MKIFMLIFPLATIFSQNILAQNVGIGTITPGAKLHIVNGASGYNSSYFPGMILEGNSNTYLNFLTPNGSESSVLFGKASDASSGGIVYNNTANLNGLQFRTNGNVTRMVINLTGNVGIGTTTPNAPLSFPASLGKKITLYPGTTGDVGLAVAGNRFQIYSDNPSADVAIGYDVAGTFNERFAFKPNGALAINGNAGTSGQVLQSNGAGAAATWVSPAAVHTIGESYGGGIVFYVYDNGLHGLIAATADQSTGVQWANNVNITNAVRDGLVAGKFNTERIIIYQGAGAYAAQICANYQGGNYGDWYLPSKYEVNLLYLQRAVVGGFASASYWSSTEWSFDNFYAWDQSFISNSQSTAPKANSNRVRAIRAF
ncbi:MAG: DUF1566 domain-containing protein [Ferruginibacter sp.]